MMWGPAVASTWNGSDATRPATSRTSSLGGKILSLKEPAIFSVSAPYHSLCLSVSCSVYLSVILCLSLSLFPLSLFLSPAIPLSLSLPPPPTPILSLSFAPLSPFFPLIIMINAFMKHKVCRDFSKHCVWFSLSFTADWPFGVSLCRYIGMPSGVLRMFPGTLLDKSFEPTQRAWSVTFPHCCICVPSPLVFYQSCSHTLFTPGFFCLIFGLWHGYDFCLCYISF